MLCKGLLVSPRSMVVADGLVGIVCIGTRDTPHVGQSATRSTTGLESKGSKQPMAHILAPQIQ